MRSKELNSLRLQLESLLNRVNRTCAETQETADELHQVGLALKRLVDFTLPATEKADGG